MRILSVLQVLPVLVFNPNDDYCRVIKKFLAKLEDVFNLCIDRLKDELRSKYQDLAIFSEDVNIMPEV